MIGNPCSVSLIKSTIQNPGSYSPLNELAFILKFKNCRLIQWPFLSDLMLTKLLCVSLIDFTAFMFMRLRSSTESILHFSMFSETRRLKSIYESTLSNLVAWGIDSKCKLITYENRTHESNWLSFLRILGEQHQCFLSSNRCLLKYSPSLHQSPLFMFSSGCMSFSLKV